MGFEYVWRVEFEQEDCGRGNVNVLASTMIEADKKAVIYLNKKLSQKFKITEASRGEAVLV